MKILDSLEKIHIQEETAVAIGKFDGVHLGHRALITELLNSKKEHGYATVIFTFSPSPAEYFGLSDGKQIMTASEKRAVLEEIGIDYLVEFPFNKDTADILPNQFVEDMLHNRLHARFIVAGDDLSFGRKGAGHIDTLCKLGIKYGYTVKEISKIKLDDVEISSSEIRRLISINNLSRAELMIGEPYSIRGKIISGNRIGRTIGFPTINVAIDAKKVLPKFGVYYSKIAIDGEVYFGISNIGVKPTIASDNAVSIETFIFEFDKDVYGREASIYLMGYRRGEQKFDGIDALKAQLDLDIAAGYKYFGINTQKK